MIETTQTDISKGSRRTKEMENLRKPLRMRKDCVKVVQHIQQENFEY